jgi:hypothetical protein
MAGQPQQPEEEPDLYDPKRDEYWSLPEQDVGLGIAVRSRLSCIPGGKWQFCHDVFIYYSINKYVMTD